jgi:hypothetical protein
MRAEKTNNENAKTVVAMPLRPEGDLHLAGDRFGVHAERCVARRRRVVGPELDDGALAAEDDGGIAFLLHPDVGDLGVLDEPLEDLGRLGRALIGGAPPAGHEHVEHLAVVNADRRCLRGRLRGAVCALVGRRRRRRRWRAGGGRRRLRGRSRRSGRRMLSRCRRRRRASRCVRGARRGRRLRHGRQRGEERKHDGEYEAERPSKRWDRASDRHHVDCRWFRSIGQALRTSAPDDDRGAGYFSFPVLYFSFSHRPPVLTSAHASQRLRA